MKFFDLLRLVESMSVYVKDYDDENNINSLDDLANKLSQKAVFPFINKMSPEQQQKIRSPYEVVTPDGDYYSSGKETINVYTDGFPDPNKLIQAVEYYLKELGVKYKLRQETSGMFGTPVVRIDVEQWQQTQNAPPLLNMANANARLIFGDLLKIPGDESGFFDIQVADLYRKIEELEQDQINIHARDPYASQQAGKAQIYHGGLNDKDIMARLEQIKKICVWAMQNHYTALDVA